MKNSFLVLFLIFTLSVSCNKKAEKIEIVNLEKILSAKHASILSDTAKVSSFAFGDIIPIEQWDRLIVIPPYTNLTMLRTAEIGNSQQITKELEKNMLREELCTLLFLWGKKVVAYTILQRSIIDFTTLTNHSGITNSFSRIECEHFYLKKEKYKDEIWISVHLNKSR